MLALRIACIVGAAAALAATFVLCTVALVAPWWTPGPTAPGVGAGAVDPRLLVPGEAEEEGVNSEITLWAHVGCAGKESWTEICNLPAKACVAAAPTQAPQWRPTAAVEAGSTGLPTLDPFRVTTPSPVRSARSDYGCVTGNANCGQPPITTEDPQRWGQTPAYPGDGQANGDALARIVEGSTVTAELPPQTPMPPETTKPPRPTPAPQPTPAPIGKRPGEGEGPKPPADVPEQGFFAKLWEEHGPSGTVPAPAPLATELDPLARPKTSTTQAPARPPGVEQVRMLCPMARSPEAAAAFACRLRGQCGRMGQARAAMIGALVLSALAAPALAAFGSGGGGPTAKGKSGAVKRGLGLLAAGLAVSAAIAAGAALGAASGVSVPHSMDGPGASCAGAAIPCGVLAAVLMASAALMALACPGRPEGSEDGTDKKGKEADLEQAQKGAEEAYPALQLPPQRPLALRVAWMPPPEQPQEAPQMVAEEGPAPLPAVTPTRSEVSALRQRGDLTGMMLKLPPQEPEAAPSPTAERCLRRFYEGEGAVYAQRLFGQGGLRAADGAYGGDSPGSGTATAISTARSSIVGGWEAGRSPRSGNIFYFNRESGESQWEPPSASPSRPGTPSPPGSPVSLGGPVAVWMKKRSKRTGQVYSVRLAPQR